MAWARDAESGRPRYVLELDAAHRGAACGCECPGCGGALVAVNAAKAEVVLRPHFRHASGIERDDCSVVAARLAALVLLCERGLLDLPRRRVTNSVEGWSGRMHSACAEAPPERVRVVDLDLRDRVQAVVTLEDGRVVRVDLAGQPREGMAGQVEASITINLRDGELTSLDPAALLGRLAIDPEVICWHAHWQDTELAEEARQLAQQQAWEELDYIGQKLDVPADVTEQLRWQTLLHFEVKSIVEREKRLTVPGLEGLVEETGGAGDVQQRRWVAEPATLELKDVQLERRLGRVVPDVTCIAELGDGGEQPLIIEVTVTNTIDEERLARIRELGIAAIEIDLSRTGGRVTRPELRQIVVEGLQTKRWLHPPNMTAVEDLLRGQMKAQLDRLARAQEDPLERVVRRYLGAVEGLLMYRDSIGRVGPDDPSHYLSREVSLCAAELEGRGFLGAGDDALIGHHAILARLLSIQHDRGIGYGYRSAYEVLNAIRQAQGSNRCEWSLALIAVKAYKPKLTPKQHDSFSRWRTAVMQSIARGDRDFLRPRTYDALLSLLFPDMAEALAKPYGTREGTMRGWGVPASWVSQARAGGTSIAQCRWGRAPGGGRAAREISYDMISSINPREG